MDALQQFSIGVGI